MDIGDGKPTEENYNRFLNNNALQEAYFEVHTKNYTWPKAKKLYKKQNGGNLNLTIPEIGGLVHFQGEGGAQKIVSSGTHKGKTKVNMGSEKYLNRFNSGVSKRGYNGLSHDKTIGYLKTEKQIKQAYIKHKESIAEINSTDLSQEAKASAVESLNKKAWEQGYIGENEDGPWNEIIKKENEAQELVHNKEVEELQDVVNNLDDILGAKGKYNKLRYDTEDIPRPSMSGFPGEFVKNKILDEVSPINKSFTIRNSTSSLLNIPKKYRNTVKKILGLPKDASFFKHAEFLEKVQESANQYLPEGEKIELVKKEVNSKGKTVFHRQKDLHINSSFINRFPDAGNASKSKYAADVFIGDPKKDSDFKRKFSFDPTKTALKNPTIKKFKNGYR